MILYFYSPHSSLVLNVTTSFAIPRPVETPKAFELPHRSVVHIFYQEWRRTIIHAYDGANTPLSNSENYFPTGIGRWDSRACAVLCVCNALSP